jgi:hypothetical protein
MKTRFILCTFAILAVAAFGSPVLAQTDGGFDYGFGVGGFIDENGDGFNDLAPDADGDGIPNGLDPDYTPPLDGTGYRLGAGNGNGGCDEDGFMYREGFQWKHTKDTSGYGPGDGTGNGGTGPGDGTGFGPGDGTCIPTLDGSGEGVNGHGVRR